MEKLFFEIKPNKKQPFIVSTPSDAKIEVIGTKFNVDAYNNKPFVSVTLMEGVVNFLFNENSQHKRLTMQAGQKTVYDRASSKTKLYRTSGKPETAWKDGKIIFEKTSFEEALQMLEKRFHVEFIIKSPRFKDDFFSGEFTTQRLDWILEHFKLSSNIHWRYLETDREKEEKTKLEIY
jgi:ferric-dicitrate binding protein FerR (iron transport regulator)